MGRDDEAVRRIGRSSSCTSSRARPSRWPRRHDDLTDPARAVALGTDIWPHGRWRVDLPGEANHAGTTRIDDRQDAMIGLAEVIQAARSYAVGLGCVATVGKVDVVPGGVNAIAEPRHGLARRTRSERAVVHAVVDAAAEAARMAATTTEESWTPTTTFDTDSWSGCTASSPTRRCSARAPGTTRASSRRTGCRARCSSSATPQASHTHRPSSRAPRTATMGSRPSPPS